MTKHPDKVETFPGICSECGTTADLCHAYAVTIGKSRSFTPCAACLEKVRKGELRPDTRRLYAAGDLIMYQILKLGQEADKPLERLPPEAARLITELVHIVRDDPHKGTEFETAFLENTKERTQQIGWKLYELGGHPLMVFAHAVVLDLFGSSARSLEMAWNGCGEWFD